MPSFHTCPPWPGPTRDICPPSSLLFAQALCPSGCAPHSLPSWRQNHSGCDAESGTALPREGPPAWAGTAQCSSMQNFSFLLTKLLLCPLLFLLSPRPSPCPRSESWIHLCLLPPPPSLQLPCQSCLSTALSSSPGSPPQFCQWPPICQPPPPPPRALFLPSVSFLGASRPAHLPFQPPLQDCGLPRL